MVNLQKETQKVSQIILTKSGGKQILCSVALDIDVSGSARPYFKQGTMQALVERVLPVAMSLDDNKTLDMWVFDDGCRKVASVTEGNYDGYVDRSILNAGGKLWGGTNYTPVLKENQKEFGGGLFSKAKPTLIYFVTDGANADQRDTTKLLETWEDKKLPLYLMFVGIGTADFAYLAKTADRFGNCGYTNVKRLEDAVTGDAFYDELTPQELVDWFAKSR